MTTENTVKRCRLCKERPVTSAHLLKRSMYYCKACWRDLPCNRLAQSTQRNPRRLAQVREAWRRSNARAIYLGGGRAGYATTPEQAQRIRAHIRSRMAEFKRSAKTATSVAMVDRLGS